MASIEQLQKALASIAGLKDSDTLDLQALRANRTVGEREVIDLIAKRLGSPKELTVGELRLFAQDLFQSAGTEGHRNRDWDRTHGQHVVHANATAAVDGAFAVAQAANRRIAAPGAANVRNVKSTDWATDKTVRATYFPASSVMSYARGNIDVLETFLDNLEGTGVNAVVVDIKEGDGRILVKASSTDATRWSDELEAVLDRTRAATPADLAEIAAAIHARGMTVIARQVVFKDEALVRHHPESAIKDAVSKGSWGSKKIWVNPWNEEAGTYNIEIAMQALAAGVDEIQFDYIRFPDQGTGDRKRVSFPGRPDGAHYCDAITAFLRRARKEIKAEFPQSKIGVDVFGYVAAGRNVRDALGQDVGEMAKYVDVIWPMQYPSHWAWKGGAAFGTKHPETKPKKVYESTTKGLIRQIGDRGKKVEIRPWLQAFYMKRFGGLAMEAPESGQLGDYVAEQLRGIKAGDANGYALWGRGSPMRGVYRALTEEHRKVSSGPRDGPGNI